MSYESSASTFDASYYRISDTTITRDQWRASETVIGPQRTINPRYLGDIATAGLELHYKMHSNGSDDAVTTRRQYNGSAIAEFGLPDDPWGE